MAENKNSFLLYCDIQHTVHLLTDVEAGKLFKHVLMYVNDMNPESEDPIINIAFEPIKQSLKRDLKKYENIKNKRSNAGKASAEARGKQKQQKSTHVKYVQQTSTLSTVSDSDSDSVSDIKEKVICLFNEITGKKIRLTAQRKKLISARQQEGFSLDDFKQVIATKFKEWANDEKMKKFITLETLFAGVNFAKYLEQNQKINIPIATQRREGSLSNGMVI